MSETVSSILTAIKGMNPLLLVMLVLLLVLTANAYREWDRELRIVDYVKQQNEELQQLMKEYGKCKERLEEHENK